MLTNYKFSYQLFYYFVINFTEVKITGTKRNAKQVILLKSSTEVNP
jgi:hypothetical protein